MSDESPPTKEGNNNSKGKKFDKLRTRDDGSEPAQYIKQSGTALHLLLASHTDS